MGYWKNSLNFEGPDTRLGNHWGDLIFDAQDAWVVDEVDWKEKYGTSIKHAAVHELGARVRTRTYKRR